MIISAYAKERRSNEFTPSGTELEPTYSYEVDKRGLKILRENGKKNVYEQIQEHLEDTKIENIIQRVVAGDTSMLRPDAIYEDVSEMPNNLLDAMNQIKALERTYDNLTPEVKAKYPTIEAFVKDAGSEAWMIANGYIKNNVPLVTEEKVIAEQIKEVTPNES